MSVTVGSFRKELEHVRALRPKTTKEIDLFTENELILRSTDIGSPIMKRDENQLEIQPLLKSLKLEQSIPRISLSFKSKPGKPTHSNAHPPSNPLLDESIKIIRPTAWIDCISRESRRVFVQDYWIIARILLPMHNNDSGLRNLK